jgi:hypothetical protein
MRDTGNPRVPRQVCEVCGAIEYVQFGGRGFPPDAAKRRLKLRCKAAGHRCEAWYYAGVLL